MNIALDKVLQDRSKRLVGIMCRRFEVLENSNLNIKELKILYKNIIKEHIYEEYRDLYNLLIPYCIPTMIARESKGN